MGPNEYCKYMHHNGGVHNNAMSTPYVPHKNILSQILDLKCMYDYHYCQSFAFCVIDGWSHKTILNIHLLDFWSGEEDLNIPSCNSCAQNESCTLASPMKFFDGF
jgi:hypothetical protein